MWACVLWWAARADVVAAAARAAGGSTLDDSMELGGGGAGGASPRRSTSWSNSPALQHYVPEVGLIRPPPMAPMESFDSSSMTLSPRDEIRQRLLSVNTDEIAPMHVRSPDAFKKEAAFESLDYNLVESNLQILAQRAVPSSQKAKKRRKITLMRWILTICVGIATGTVASFINFGVKNLNLLKYGLTVSQIEEAFKNPDDLAIHFVKPCFVFVALNMCYVLVATLLVSFVEPVSRGSGIPEVKCYLNGVSVPRVVRFKTLACKAVGVLFSVAGGLPVGKEGPMIHSGAVVGAGVSQGRQMQQLWERLGWNYTRIKKTFNAYRNDHEKRDFVACGTAAGVAAAFGAPIGGALFALEEGATHWNDFLTWRSFVCAMVSGFTLDVWMSVLNNDEKSGMLDQKGSITFGTFTSQDAPYTAQEVPFFILLGMFGGLVGAGFNQLNERLTVWRKANVVKHGTRNVLEALFVAMTAAVIAFVIPYISIKMGNPCISKTKFEEPGKPGGVKIQSFSTFYCPDAPSNNSSDGGTGDIPTVNDYALLFFQPSEDTIKMLFHSDQDFSVGSLAVFSAFYFMLACVTYGIAVPSGLFVPSLLLGAAFGRLYGQMMQTLLNLSLSQAGVYSLIGSAAMLGGMARMTISITVIMIEATNDYSYGLPLMLTLMTARWVGNSFNEGLYDIHIHLNQVPLLEGTALVGPWEQTRAQDILTATGIMSPCVPNQHKIEEVEKVVDILALLRRSKANAFFVTEPKSGALSGVILRKQLCQLLQDGVYTKPGVLSDPIMWDDTINTYPKCARMPCQFQLTCIVHSICV
jgi:H+/Cl- antiporter ClcA